MTLERKTALKRGKPLKTTTIRHLAADEEHPAGEPKRYAAHKGYVRLRWKVAPYTYVECYERDESQRLVRTVPSSEKWIDVARLRALHEQGLSQPQIAKELGCKAGSVSRALRRMGIEARRKVDYAPEVDVEEVLRRYNDSEGYGGIAKSMGISVERVRAVLVSAGISIRPVGRVKGKKHGPRKGTVSYETEFERMKPEVRARSGGICECRWSPNCTARGTHIHHRKLRSQGGKNDMATLMDVCLSCHMTIHGNPQQARELGFLVRRSQDPAKIGWAPLRKVN